MTETVAGWPLKLKNYFSLHTQFPSSVNS